MTLLEGLFRRVASPEAEGPLTASRLLEWLGGPATDAGVQVSERTALHMPAVWRAVALISCVSAALPLHTFARGTRDRSDMRLLEEPHPELTDVELWRLSYAHRTLWGNSYQQKIRNRAGVITELWPITPDRVQVGRVRPTDALPGGKVFAVTDDWGAVHALTTREILHIPGPVGYDGVTGCSPIRAAAQGIGLAVAAEKAGATFFGKGAMLSGVLQTEQRLDADQAAQLKAAWAARVAGAGNAGDIAVLDSGASFQPVTMPMRDAQFLESRRFQVVEIARMFGVPPYLLMDTERSTSWGTGLEQQAAGFVTFDLAPAWLRPTEARITKELARPTGRYARYSLEGLLRPDSRARAEFYRVMREIGVYSANDIRDLEDRPPIPGGDTYLQPLNMTPLGNAGAPVDGDQDDQDQEDDDDAV